MRLMQYLTPFRPNGHVLMLATLFYQDEIVPETALPPISTADIAPGA